MLGFIKKLGRSIGGGVKWLGRQVAKGGKIASHGLHYANEGLKTLGRQVAKIPGGGAIVDMAKKALDAKIIPVVGSVRDLYNKGKEMASNVTGVGRAVNDVGRSLSSADILRMREDAKRLQETLRKTKDSVMK